MRALRTVLIVLFFTALADWGAQWYFAILQWRTAGKGTVETEHLETPDGIRYGKTVGELALQSTPFLGYRLTPNQHSDHFSVNSLGLRGPELGEPASRILMTGGSVVFGSKLQDADTIPSQLSRLTAREVLNAGVPGYHSGHELVLLATRGRALAPKTVVTVSGWNDYFLSCDTSDHYVTDHAFEQISERLLDYGYFTSEYFVVRAARGFLETFYPTLVEISRRLRRGGSSHFNDPQVAANSYIENLLAERMIANALGASFLVVLQADHKALAYLQDGKNPVSSRCPVTYVEFLKLVKARLDQESIAVLPLGLEPDGLPLHVFTDAVHLTPEGNEIVAKRIAEMLSTRG